MQTFHEFIAGELAKWFVFDNTDLNKLSIDVKSKETGQLEHHILKKGDYFQAIVSSAPFIYMIADKGNIDFIFRDALVRIQNEEALTQYQTEKEAIKASELVFTGYPDPEGEGFEDRYTDKLTDVGMRTR